jgi:F-type H+-transporting ATPase subunit delta
MYARVVYDQIAGNVRGAIDALCELRESIASSRELSAALSHPCVAPESKVRSLSTAVGLAAFPLLEEFLRLLIKRKRMHLLGPIIEALEDLRRERENIRRVEITSAYPLSTPDQEMVASRLSATFKAGIEPVYAVDARLIAGLLIKIDDRVIDASIRTRLLKLKEAVSRGQS